MLIVDVVAAVVDDAITPILQRYTKYMYSVCVVVNK